MAGVDQLAAELAHLAVAPVAAAVGVHPPADAVARLVHGRAEPLVLERERGVQARDPAADDRDPRRGLPPRGRGPRERGRPADRDGRAEHAAAGGEARGASTRPRRAARAARPARSRAAPPRRARGRASGSSGATVCGPCLLLGRRSRADDSAASTSPRREWLTSRGGREPSSRGDRMSRWPVSWFNDAAEAVDRRWGWDKLPRVGRGPGPDRPAEPAARAEPLRHRPRARSTSRT